MEPQQVLARMEELDPAGSPGVDSRSAPTYPWMARSRPASQPKAAAPRPEAAKSQAAGPKEPVVAKIWPVMNVPAEPSP